MFFLSSVAAIIPGKPKFAMKGEYIFPLVKVLCSQALHNYPLSNIFR